MAGLGLLAARAVGCGPDFPNNILDGGDAALLSAPVADFGRELARIHLLPASFEAKPATNGFAEQTLEAEVAELRSALRQAGQAPAARSLIIDGYLRERQKLMDFRESLDAWQRRDRFESEQAPKPPRPVLGSIEIGENLPEQFSGYLRGCVAWYSGETNAARTAWLAVLNLPAPERRLRSTWAAFMLGKSWESEERQQAIQFYQQVRSLAGTGFSDRLGLAAASLGREALMQLRAEHLESALEIYLQQLTTGDETAINSLRFAVARALGSENPDVLPRLAANPRTQRVITAYLLSRRVYGESSFDRSEFGRNWLAAVELANVRDVESAEVLTLAAYRAGEWELAQRWIDRAAPTPTVEWIQAKLLLRAGKTDDAATVLARVIRQFPTTGETNSPPRLEDNLTMTGASYFFQEIHPQEQALAELGALQLSRREYAEALDALARSGFWMDAAYVAESVLTVDELKSYVDRAWPAVETTADVGETQSDAARPQMDVREQLRYLLARRLTRLNRAEEAREYFPASWLPQLAMLTQTLAAGRDESSPYGQRFQMLAVAADITRTNGMELMGSELEPDWHIFEGNFDWGLSVADRTNETGLIQPDEDELTRAIQQQVVPHVRFHYREFAADLRAEAAGLGEQAALSMPDESDEKARLLCRCGTWRAERNPKAAYADYQNILRHCSHTEIGVEAARTGRIPKLDGAGRVIRWIYRAEDFPTPGRSYLVHVGDTLFRITKLLNDSGHALTISDLLAANPKLIPEKIRAGQVIQIPLENPSVAVLPTVENSAVVAQNEVSEEPPKGEYYVIHSGDTLPAIVEAVRSLGLPLTLQSLVDANPGLNPSHLKIGQKIFIPYPTSADSPTQTSNQ